MKTRYAFLIFLLIPISGFAKRLPAPEVTPVVHEGVKYTAPNEDGRKAVVEAWDVTTRKMKRVQE